MNIFGVCVWNWIGSNRSRKQFQVQRASVWILRRIDFSLKKETTSLRNELPSEKSNEHERILVWDDIGYDNIYSYSIHAYREYWWQIRHLLIKINIHGVHPSSSLQIFFNSLNCLMLLWNYLHIWSSKIEPVQLKKKAWEHFIYLFIY